MAHCRSNAVITSVPSSNNNDVFVPCADVIAFFELGIQQRLGIELQEFHSEVYAVRTAVGDLKISRPCRTGTNDDGIVLGTNFVNIHINADV
jgi:hypothetical protein